MWDEEVDIFGTFDEHELEYAAEESFSDLDIDFESPEIDEFDDD